MYLETLLWFMVIKKMECRSRAIPEQFATLLKFMERHGDMARPQQGPHGRIKADRLWLELEGLLNTTPGGVKKSMEKWKKVWADWKAKTKKKALTKRGEDSGTGGGSISRQPLSAFEERVLAIMGLTAVIGKVGIEERSFAALPSESNSLPAPTDPIQIVDRVCPSQISDPDETQATSSASTPTSPISMHSPPGEIPSPAPSPPPSTASPPMPSATSPTPSTPRGAPQRRRHHASPSPTGAFLDYFTLGTHSCSGCAILHSYISPFVICSRKLL
ncbi:unnamed protein product [Arctia plantaginis]|uniref:Regulatory protein zeste n=1 Tax=Arctia plantaginis TaxID=874455 RepID=A0A8S0YSQ2_ARCPL|nr:unnamed protein product [Arctia plantaginis]